MNGEALVQLRMVVQLLSGVSDILGEEDPFDHRRMVVGAMVDLVSNLADLWEDQGARIDGRIGDAEDS